MSKGKMPVRDRAGFLSRALLPYLILFVLHELPEGRLLGQHLSPCTLYNRLHRCKARADARGDVEILCLEINRSVLFKCF